MATQQDTGIPFSFAHEQQRFTLLELPAEVLEIVTAPNTSSSAFPAPLDMAESDLYTGCLSSLWA